MRQCIARKKDFERCRNHADPWSFFCRRHRWWWLITLLGAIVVVTTIGSNIAQILDVFFPNRSRAITTSVSTETSMPNYIPAPLTETLVFTATYMPKSTITMTPVSPETFGGLTSDCIPDLYWDALDPRIIPDPKGCLQVVPWGLYAGDREIFILLNPQDVRESISQTIFLPISGNIDIPFNIVLEEMKDGSDPKSPPLFSIGICNPNRIKTAHNFISYSYQSDGSIIWGILNNNESEFHKPDIYTLRTPQSFMIKIDSFDLYIEDTKTGKYIWTNPKVSPNDLKAFCIRYQLPILGTLKVSIVFPKNK